MTRYPAISAAVIGLLSMALGGCSKDYELTAICSHDPSSGSPPHCCALGTEKTGMPASFVPENYSCQSNVTSCKSLIGGVYNAFRWIWIPSSADKDNAALNSGCASVQWKEKSSFTSAAVATLAARRLNLVKLGGTLDCRKDCNYGFGGPGTGDPNKCPAISLRSDVVGSLFTFYASVDPSSYPNDTTLVPIKTIAQAFHVSADDLKACPRTDVTVHRDGLVQNTGQKCESLVKFNDQGSDLTSKLSISDVLSGTVTESNKDVRWMEFGSQQTSFSIHHSDSTYNKLFGGYVSRSGMLFSSTVAEMVNGDGYKFCVRGDPPLSVSNADAYVTRQADAATLEKSIRAYVKGVAAHYDSKNSNRQPYPGFAEALDKLDTQEKQSLIREISSAAPKVKVDDFYLASLSNWLDAALCEKMLYRDGKLNHDLLDAFNNRFVFGQGSERREQASANLLRCAFADAHLSENFKQALQKVIPQ